MIEVKAFLGVGVLADEDDGVRHSGESINIGALLLEAMADQIR